MLVQTPPPAESERSSDLGPVATKMRSATCHDAPVSSSVLSQARAGDEQAFSELTAPYLNELHLHCYRMLGSLTDAEDLLQETLIAAWQGLGGFAGRSSLRTWLYRVATNRCLNAIRDAKRRPPGVPVPPFTPPDPSRLGEVTWLQPFPDSWLRQSAHAASSPAMRHEAREGVELAFITALQRLPPRQTAAMVLIDVLDFSTAEVARMLDTSPTAVKGALQRGRATLASKRTGAGHDPLGGRGSVSEQHLANRFTAAFTAGDVEGVVALLTDDAWLAMPPAPHEYQGGEAIASFLHISTIWRGQRRISLLPTRANGQPAFGCYLSHPGEPTAYPTGVLVLTMSSDRISGITRFLDDELHRQFGLPDTAGPGSTR